MRAGTATDVIVASGTPFAWLWMLTVSSNSTICLHGSQLGLVGVTNPNWLPCKHIVELEETVSIHNHAKGVPDATMTSVAFQLASGPKEPLKKKKTVKCPRFFFLSAALLDRMRAGTQLMSSLRRAPLLHGYGC